MLQTAQRSNFGSLSRRLDQAFELLVHRQCAHFSPREGWAPAINAYRLADRFEVCVELAGVDPDTIEVHAHPHQLTIGGVRQPPEPSHEPREPLQILSMEIDHGRFERVIRLPRRINVEAVSLSAQTGLLWIRMPLLKRAAVR